MLQRRGLCTPGLTDGCKTSPMSCVCVIWGVGGLLQCSGSCRTGHWSLGGGYDGWPPIRFLLGSWPLGSRGILWELDFFFVKDRP